MSQLKSKPKPSIREKNIIEVKLENKSEAVKDKSVDINIPIKNIADKFLLDRSLILEKIKPVLEESIQDKKVTGLKKSSKKLNVKEIEDDNEKSNLTVKKKKKT